MGVQSPDVAPFSLDSLSDADAAQSVSAIRCLRNSVIGSKRCKTQVIACGLVPRLLKPLDRPDISVQLLSEVLVTLNSLALGDSCHGDVLVRYNILPQLVKGLQYWLDKPACVCLFAPALRCLRSVLRHCPPLPASPRPDSPSVPQLVPLLLSCAALSSDPVVHQCAMTSLALLCRSADCQQLLLTAGVPEFACSLLCSRSHSVLLACLRLLSALCFNNCVVAEHLTRIDLQADAECGSVVERVSHLTGRRQDKLVQLEAARCLCCLYRSGTLAVDSSHENLVSRALPALLRLCGATQPPALRVAAADVLSYLLEFDTGPQRIASQLDFMLKTVASFLDYTPTSAHPSTQRQQLKMVTQMRRAAFMVFSSLASHDAPTRTRVLEVPLLMKLLVHVLQTDSWLEAAGASGADREAEEERGGGGRGAEEVRANVTLVVAALKCLLSLSRSVHTLRTVLQDYEVWLPVFGVLRRVMDIINTNSCSDSQQLLSVAVAATALLCNLLLDFCPGRPQLLDRGCVPLLTHLSRHLHPPLRLNAVWCLMNVSYQADQQLKRQLLDGLCSGSQLFYLATDPAPAIVVKTLGLLRNLFSRSSVDQLTADSQHGHQLMQTVVVTLEGEHSAEVKEQILCLLASIASGSRARDLIMDNDDVLIKIVNYMVHSDTRLATAAVLVLAELAWRGEDGSRDRQARLRRMGVVAILQNLQCTSVTVLFDAVKSALFQFS